MERLGSDVVRAAIGERFPTLAGLAVTPLGEGADHAAFDVGGRYVFRFARHADGGAGLAVEARLTAWLAPQVPLPVPDYRFVADDAAPLGPFAGYERLAGAPALLVAPARIDSAACGRALGAFLRALHSCDVAAAAELGVPPDDDPSCEAWSAEALADVRFVCARGQIGSARAMRWQQVLALPPAVRHARPRLIHGDLAAEHVLVDDAGVPRGIIDWSDAVLADPARDIAGLFHWADAELLAAALDIYEDADPAMRARARWFAACRAVADIAFGETRRRPEYVAAGLRALTFLEDRDATG